MRHLQWRTGNLGRQSGFNLVELLVVVAIIAILTMIAFPSYQDHMRKTRRTDAKAALTELANKQEKFFSNNTPPHYAATITGAWPNTLGYTTATSPEGYYDLSVAVGANNSTFTATATPHAGGPQIGDGNLTISSTGVKQYDKNHNGTFDANENTWD